MSLGVRLEMISKAHTRPKVPFSLSVACGSEWKGPQLPGKSQRSSCLYHHPGQHLWLSTRVTGAGPCPAFYVGFKDSNSGPQACVAESSPQPTINLSYL